MKIITVDQLETLIKRMKESGVLTGKEEVWFKESRGGLNTDHTVLDVEVGYRFHTYDNEPLIIGESGLPNFKGEPKEGADEVVFCLSNTNYRDEKYSNVYKMLKGRK